jgi:branched-subunit amino acid ABC-type transport system permease component
VALAVTLGVVAPAVGITLHRLVMRKLADSAEVTKIIVPVSVMLGFLGLANLLWDPSPDNPRTFAKFFGASQTVQVAGVNLTYHELLAVGLSAVIALALRYGFTRARTGVATRAVVDDPALLQLNGGRPERLATTAWALGAVLAALAGILITPIQGGTISSTTLTLLVVDAFAAAMFGRLRSVPRTYVGGLVLGLVTSYIIGYAPADRWTWVPNLRASIPMIVLFVVLLALPQDRLRGITVRATRERFRLPSMPNALAGAAALVGVVYLLREIMAPTAINTLSFGMTLAVIALSLVLLTGYAGEINLAAISFGAIGAIVVYHYGTVGSGPEARTTLGGYLLAAAVCAAVGGLVALPALRLRGLYLALATLSFGVLVSNMVLRETDERVLPLLHERFMIFPYGSITVARPRIGSFDMDGSGTFLLAVTVLFAVLGVGLIAFRHSNYGRRVAALRDSPAAAATLGMNAVRLKLLLFMTSAAIAGVGGALMSAQIGAVNIDRFDIFLSLTLLMVAVVGGIGYVSGALFAGIFVGVALPAMTNTLDKVGADHVGLQGLTDLLVDLVPLLPATIGIALARNPNGAVHDIAAGFRTIGRARPVVAGALVVEAVLYGLVRQGVLDNWWFVVCTAGLLAALPAAVRALVPAALDDGRSVRDPLDGAALELAGLDGPLDPALVAALDRGLGLSRVPAGRARPAPSAAGATSLAGAR